MSDASDGGRRQAPSPEMLQLIRDTLLQPVPPRPQRVTADKTPRRRPSAPTAAPKSD